MKNNEFVEELSKLGITPTEKMLNQLEIYYDELIKYNAHTNLTSITDKESVYLKHFYDSLTVIKACDLNNIKLLDIGTGAGFPGVVLKIFFPSIELYLLDSNKKKTIFLSGLCEKLRLEKVNIINKRAEEYIEGKREFFDIVVSRAVAKTRILSELALPYLKKDGLLVLLKASKKVITEEIKEAEPTLKILNSSIVNTISFVLPYENSERNIIVIKSRGNISNIYPRSYDKVVKKPLK